MLQPYLLGSSGEEDTDVNELSEKMGLSVQPWLQNRKVKGATPDAGHR
jgi:hypothetical protein